MRKIVLLLAWIALAVLSVCGVALAATIGCPNQEGNLCVGTDRGDTMTGTDGTDDLMDAKGGNDTLRARGGNNDLTGGGGRDFLRGRHGDDTYRFDDDWGWDYIRDLGGRDTLDFSALDRRVRINLDHYKWRARSGMSLLTHPRGTGVSVNVEVVYGGAGNDIITAGNVTASHGDKATVFGNGGADFLRGAFGDSTLMGGHGADFLLGEGGNNDLTGGPGQDYISVGYIGTTTATDRVFAVDGQVDHIACTETSAEVIEADAMDDFIDREGNDTRELCDTVNIH